MYFRQEEQNKVKYGHLVFSVSSISLQQGSYSSWHRTYQGCLYCYKKFIRVGRNFIVSIQDIGNVRPDVFYYIHVRTIGRPVQGLNVIVMKPGCSMNRCMRRSIIMLKNTVCSIVVFEVEEVDSCLKFVCI